MRLVRDLGVEGFKSAVLTGVAGVAGGIGTVDVAGGLRIAGVATGIGAAGVADGIGAAGVASGTGVGRVGELIVDTSMLSSVFGVSI